MRLRFRDTDVPYPLSTIKGRLKLSGLSEKEVSEIIQVSASKIKTIPNPTEEILLNLVRESLDSRKDSIRVNFETLTKYEELRRKTHDIPPVVVIIEVASATGKSIIANEIVHDLVATRFISSDTVRQVLRSTMSEDDFPEQIGRASCRERV